MTDNTTITPEDEAAFTQAYGITPQPISTADIPDVPPMLTPSDAGYDAARTAYINAQTPPYVPGQRTQAYLMPDNVPVPNPDYKPGKSDNGDPDSKDTAITPKDEADFKQAYGIQDKTTTNAGVATKAVLNGATMGAAPRIEAGIGTGLANAYAALPAPVQNATLGQVNSQDLPSYNQEREQLYQQSQQGANEHPTADVLGNIAGGFIPAIATGNVVSALAPKTAAYLASSGGRVAAATKGAAIGSGTGAVQGFMNADPNDPNAMAEGAKTGALVGGLAGGTVGGIMPSRTIRAPLSQDLRQNLLDGSPENTTELGQNIGDKLTAANQNAYDAKEAAYQAAGQAGNKAYVPPDSATNLANSIDQSLSHLDPEQVTSVNSIKKYTQQLRDLSTNPRTTGIKYNIIENLRQRINAIPYKTETAAGIASARRAFDDNMEQVLNDGLISGDKNALDLIKDARSKNAYWREAFSGDKANKSIKDYLESSTEISPEGITKLFTNLGDAGYRSSEAIKEVLGQDGINLVKKAYLNNIGMKSLKGGELSPQLLTKNVDKFLRDSPSTAKTILSPDEFKSMQAIAASQGKIGLPKLAKWTGKLAPITAFLLEALHSGGNIEKTGIAASIGHGVGNITNKIDNKIATRQLTNPVLSKTYPGINRLLPKKFMNTEIHFTNGGGQS